MSEDCRQKTEDPVELEAGFFSRCSQRRVFLAGLAISRVRRFVCVSSRAYSLGVLAVRSVPTPH